MNVFIVVMLTGIWIVLCEKITLFTVLTGVAVSCGCVWFYSKYIPVNKLKNINFFALSIYPFYLLIQIYLSGFSAIKIILKGAEAETVKIKTEITNDFLRAILANSVTLTPGTISLELEGDVITALWFSKKSYDPDNKGDAGQEIIGSLEKMLLKAQK